MQMACTFIIQSTLIQSMEFSFSPLSFQSNFPSTVHVYESTFSTLRMPLFSKVSSMLMSRRHWRLCRLH